MKIIRKIAVLGSAVGLMLVADMVAYMASLPHELRLVSEAEAVAGRQRRTRRRGLAVGYAAGSAADGDYYDEDSHDASQDAAVAQQQAATAQQQAAVAQQQAAVAQQQAAVAQYPAQPAAPVTAPAAAPISMVASLPQGCVSAGEVFQCGSTYYRPFMSGNQIVYGVVPGP
jgi:hypothetical protein